MISWMLTIYGHLNNTQANFSNRDMTKSEIKSFTKAIIRECKSCALSKNGAVALAMRGHIYGQL